MRLILDTCAVLWLAEGDSSFARSAIHAIDRSVEAGDAVLVSPMSAWEIGLLVARGRLALPMPPRKWFDLFLSAPGVGLAELTTNGLISSSFLPGDPPRDPVDRVILSTAREQRLVVVTRDRVMLEYGKAGHVQALAC